MRRLAIAISVFLMTLAVSGCGDATFTLKTNAGGSNSLTVVVSGDPATIAAVKSGMPGGSTTDGDTHTGNKICETDVNDAGRTYHAVVYSTVSLPSTICSSFANGING